MYRGVSWIAAWMLSAAIAVSASYADQPPSFITSQLLPVEEVDLHIMPFVDVAALRAEDSAASVQRSRFPMKVDLTTDNSGTWESLPGGGSVWRLRVESTGAEFIVVGFDVFRVQEGAVLHMYDPSRTVLLGGFTSSDIKEHGKLWSTSIAGDVAIIELFWPEELEKETPNLHIGTVSHGYEPILPIAGGAECSPDVNCPLGLGIEVIKRGAVRLYIGNAGVICSGSLINNVTNDRTPYVLTAEHCVDAALDFDPGDDLTASEILFNYERPGCGPPPDFPPGDDRLTGLKLRSMWAGSDMALLEIDERIPSDFCARLNGWSRSTVTSPESGTIHQPAGGPPKKVAVDSDPTIIDGNFWRIAEWEIGNTQSGSSGAPLFNNGGRIIGQLCCGGNGDPPECRQDLDDRFGRFDLSWFGGGSPDTRLRDWLDPMNTNVTTHPGMEAASNTNCELTVSAPEESAPSSSSWMDIASALPTKGSVSFHLRLPVAHEVSVRVFDVGGRVVGEVLEGRMEAGTHALSWDPADEGLHLSSGTYFLHLQAGEKRESRKFVVAR